MHSSYMESAHAAETERRRLQSLFLARLERLLELRGQNHSEWTDSQRRLIHHAIASTYWDCQRVSLDVEPSALQH